eukprot:3843894-Pleurochrysis_carterae.AAC.2
MQAHIDTSPKGNGGEGHHGATAPVRRRRAQRATGLSRMARRAIQPARRRGLQSTQALVASTRRGPGSRIQDPFGEHVQRHERRTVQAEAAELIREAVEGVACVR